MLSGGKFFLRISFSWSESERAQTHIHIIITIVVVVVVHLIAFERIPSHQIFSTD
jgi:hypothetical protein